MTSNERPSWDDYYMMVAWTLSSRANCLRRRVGALIVINHRIISTGYNGTPFGVKNCNEGGCPRCSSNALRHHDYELCLCVHAEQNAMILAARQGTSTDQASLYTTLRPCIECLKLAIQAGIREIVYDQHWEINTIDNAENIYQTLMAEADITIRQHNYSESHPQLSLIISSRWNTEPETPLRTTGELS